MDNQLIRTKEGTDYLNELYPRQDLTEEDITDLGILVWAGPKDLHYLTPTKRRHPRDFPLIPERLTHQENKASVRRLFEAGYLEFKEEEEEE